MITIILIEKINENLIVELRPFVVHAVIMEAVRTVKVIDNTNITNANQWNLNMDEQYLVADFDGLVDDIYARLETEYQGDIKFLSRHQLAATIKECAVEKAEDGYIINENALVKVYKIVHNLIIDGILADLAGNDLVDVLYDEEKNEMMYKLTPKGVEMAKQLGGE